MKIIIPMAGMGKRMRPHTLTIPKPLINIAGKPIVQQLVETLSESSNNKIEEIAFVIGDFGVEVENKLKKIASDIGAKASIYYQLEALGTAHAINCAYESISGPTIVAFADTLFHANFKISEKQEAIIWASQVEDPSQFGVLHTEGSIIKGFVEKPKEFVSDLAIIGIYYFKNGENLRDELKYLIDNNLMKNGEFQLTDSLQSMLNKGVVFEHQKVDEWLDCGNKEACVYTNQRILEYRKNTKLLSEKIQNNNSLIIQPCYIGNNVTINNSIIGPHVSIGNNSKIENSIISNSIIQNNTCITNANIENSMIGNFVEYKQNTKDINIGDFTTINYK